MSGPIDGEWMAKTKKAPEEITALARDVVTNQVFIATDPYVIRDSFMILMLAGGFTEDGARQLGAVYEYLDKANPMAVNGYPSFFSARFVHRDDMDLLRSEVTRLSEALGLPVQPQKEQ